MPLSEDEVAKLTAALNDNRKVVTEETGNTTRAIKEVTDHRKVMVATRASSSQRAYHAYADNEPACGGRHGSDYRWWPKAVAVEWMGPCSFCYDNLDPSIGLEESSEDLSYGPVVSVDNSSRLE